MRLEMTRSRRAFLLAGIIVTAVGSVATLGINLYDDPFDDRAFSAAEWRTAAEQRRAGMARDAIRHLPPGTTADEVVRLLGEPDGDAGGPRLSYSLGFWPRAGFDAAFLYVHTDPAGRVTHAEVSGY